MGDTLAMATGESRSQPRLVSLNLAGSNFTIRTDASQEYVTRLESYVNEKLNAVQPDGRPLPLKSALALAALSIADDYFSAEESRAELDQSVRKRVKRILTGLDDAMETDVED